MRIHKFLTTIRLCLIICIALIPWGTVAAYAIGNTWASNSATYYYHSSLPTNWRAGTDYGANQWTNVTTSSWAWSLSGSSVNLIKLGAIDGAGGTAAVTTLWINGSGKITKIEIKYDQSENWYVGSGLPGSNQLDLRSTATHEFGHALGLNHTQSANCSSPKATMCPTQSLGSTEFRSLETDDKNGVTAAYP